MTDAETEAERDVEAAERVAPDPIVAEAAVVSAGQPRIFYQRRSNADAAAKSMMRSRTAPTRRFVIEGGGEK